MLPDPSLPDLRVELLARAERDQAARHARDRAATDEVDADNVAWLAPLLERHGWLGADLVGDDGACACWLLVQHAPPGRQDQWLPLLCSAVVRGTAGRRELAYLQDRVDLHHGRPQAHGTQSVGLDGGPVRLWPVRDRGTVNARRAELDLPPLDARTLDRAWTDEEIDGRVPRR